MRTASAGLPVKKRTPKILRYEAVLGISRIKHDEDLSDQPDDVHKSDAIIGNCEQTNNPLELIGHQQLIDCALIVHGIHIR